MESVVLILPETRHAPGHSLETFAQHQATVKVLMIIVVPAIDMRVHASVELYVLLSLTI
jgi:hypothetical protein